MNKGKIQSVLYFDPTSNTTVKNSLKEMYVLLICDTTLLLHEDNAVGNLNLRLSSEK